MKSTKIMLSGIMVMMLAIFTFVIDMGKGSWLSATALALSLIAVIMFIAGLLIKDKF